MYPEPLAYGVETASRECSTLQKVGAVSRQTETPPSWNPAVGLFLGFYGGPWGGEAFFYERGTSVEGWSTPRKYAQALSRLQVSRAMRVWIPFFR